MSIAAKRLHTDNFVTLTPTEVLDPCTTGRCHQTKLVPMVQWFKRTVKLSQIHCYELYRHCSTLVDMLQHRNSLPFRASAWPTSWEKRRKQTSGSDCNMVSRCFCTLQTNAVSRVRSFPTKMRCVSRSAASDAPYTTTTHAREPLQVGLRLKTFIVIFCQEKA